jgi:molybdopterin synthase catalytic subunit
MRGVGGFRPRSGLLFGAPAVHQGAGSTLFYVLEPGSGETWIALTTKELPVGAVYDWTVRPDCGAVVLFSGTVRDHADGRDGVSTLTYEAYEEQCERKFDEIASEIRHRWPDTGRIAILHRLGTMEVTISTVIVAVSSPHRPEAFEAARFGIDALKATAPIWKHEVWSEGADWGTGATPPRDVTTVPSASTEN